MDAKKNVNLETGLITTLVNALMSEKLRMTAIKYVQSDSGSIMTLVNASMTGLVTKLVSMCHAYSYAKLDG